MLAQQESEARIARSTLQTLIRNRSLVFSSKGKPFVLASRKESPFYFDMKKVTMERESATLIARCLEPLIPPGVDQVGGLETGAVPIVQVLVDLSGQIKRGFFVRKVAKEHGLRGTIEGNFDSKKPSLLVDDVTTTGESVLKAIEAVQDAGGQIAKVIAIVDRESGGSQRVRERGLDYEAIFRLADFDLSN